MSTLDVFAFFHLNLAFSSIEEDQRQAVIARCYWPLLRLAERIFPIGIEATGFTLEEIAARDPAWIAEIKRLIEAGKVEFIASGYSQMIAPLVPARVTKENLAIGNAIYARELAVTPTVALVNEQAYGGGVVALYLEAGYRAILMDWDNPSSHHHWPAETCFQPQRVRAPDGQAIQLLWTNTVAFQKLQRYVHGDCSLADYVGYVRTLRAERPRTVCLYASDAEIFDYRPGRYRTEEVFDEGAGSEWQRLADAFAALAQEPGCRFLSPSQILDGALHSEPLQLESPDCPVPVKKQRKYNLSRWAVTGRDDVALNAACERIYRALCEKTAPQEEWKALCGLWASDYRTHITEMRWTAAKTKLAALAARHPWSLPPLTVPPQSEPDSEEIHDRNSTIATPSLSASLDRRRGMALTSVAFGGPALIGTLPLGTFDDIALQADWYTGNSVLEAPGEHKITDLEWCAARRWRDGEDEMVFARVPTPKGPIEKTLRFCAHRPRIDVDITFYWSDWGKGSLRLGHVTLLPAAFDCDRLSLTTHNGGYDAETFALSGHDVDLGAPVSFLVSASGGLGMTEGWAELGDDRHRIRIAVDRTCAPLMGLVTHRRLRGGPFCQFALSAIELDDTRKPTPLDPDAPRRFRFSIGLGKDGKSE